VLNSNPVPRCNRAGERVRDDGIWSVCQGAWKCRPFDRGNKLCRLFQFEQPEEGLGAEGREWKHIPRGECYDLMNGQTRGADTSVPNQMYNWVSNHRPAIVVLENVCSAPWGQVAEKFEEIGYSAIPQRYIWRVSCPRMSWLNMRLQHMQVRYERLLHSPHPNARIPRRFPTT
jgi:hypothetical protein